MSERYDGGPAFPQPVINETGRDRYQTVGMIPGMSVRDHFAAAALPLVFQILKEGQEAIEKGDGISLFAKVAYALADAMLEQRRKP